MFGKRKWVTVFTTVDLTAYAKAKQKLSDARVPYRTKIESSALRISWDRMDGHTGRGAANPLDSYLLQVREPNVYHAQEALREG